MIYIQFQFTKKYDNPTPYRHFFLDFTLCFAEMVKSIQLEDFVVNVTKDIYASHYINILVIVLGCQT